MLGEDETTTADAESPTRTRGLAGSAEPVMVTSVPPATSTVDGVIEVIPNGPEPGKLTLPPTSGAGRPPVPEPPDPEPEPSPVPVPVPVPELPESGVPVPVPGVPEPSPVPPEPAPGVPDPSPVASGV